MPRYEIKHVTQYAYSETVPLCQNEVRLTPRASARQQCLAARLIVQPEPIAVARRTDYFGNLVSSFTVLEGHRQLSVTAQSTVELTAPQAFDPASSPPWEAVRDLLAQPACDEHFDATQFLFDAPFVRRSEELAAYAAPSFPAGRPLVEAVLSLTGRIHREFTYDPTATTVSTPLDEVLRDRRGVCQDFAHLELGCLRSLGLAARYVSGYLLTDPPPGQPKLVGADASHAWVSVYCPGQGWVDFDPTNDCIPALRHVTLAWGRDYDDVCPIKGVFVGGGGHAMHVAVDVVPAAA